MRKILFFIFLSLSLTSWGQTKSRNANATTQKQDETEVGKFKDLCSKSGVLITTSSYDLGTCEVPYSIGTSSDAPKGVEKFRFNVSKISAGSITAYFLSITHLDHLYGIGGSSTDIEYGDLKQLKDAILRMKQQIGKPINSDNIVYSYVTPDDFTIRLLDANKANEANWDVKLELFTKDDIYPIPDITPFLNKIDESIAKIESLKNK